jgi:hypothetical protein
MSDLRHALAPRYSHQEGSMADPSSARHFAGRTAILAGAARVGAAGSRSHGCACDVADAAALVAVAADKGRTLNPAEGGCAAQ